LISQFIDAHIVHLAGAAGLQGLLCHVSQELLGFGRGESAVPFEFGVDVFDQLFGEFVLNCFGQIGGFSQGFFE
jgi:hypothetical protein